MAKPSRSILLVDDDEDNCFLVKEAFEELKVDVNLVCVYSGQESLDYLYHRKAYTDAARYRRPDLILLDLNMPRVNGYEVLKEIKEDPKFKKIPVVIMTSSQDEQDVLESYGLGANSYVVKPITFEGLVEAIKGLGGYWFRLVKLPGHNN